jgi:hypothetical protein
LVDCIDFQDHGKISLATFMGMSALGVYPVQNKLHPTDSLFGSM